MTLYDKRSFMCVLKLSSIMRERMLHAVIWQSVVRYMHTYYICTFVRAQQYVKTEASHPICT